MIKVHFFRGVSCDTHHCVVVAKVWERLPVSKQIMQKSGMERFYLKELNAVKDKEQYQVKISYRFTALEVMK
jgi:hypothetical protein